MVPSPPTSRSRETVLLLLLLLLGSGVALRILIRQGANSRHFIDQEARAILARDRVSPPPKGGIFFYGSSSIARWDLHRSFPGLATGNRGLSGAIIPDCTRLARQLILPFRPAVIVFYAGDNDLADGHSPTTVLSDYQALSGMIRRELPETTLIFLAIKPSPVRWSIIDRIREANRLIQSFCETDARLKYVDVTHPMLDSQGWPRREFFERDGLHLSEEGYRLWTRLVEPFLPRDANRNRPGQPF